MNSSPVHPRASTARPANRRSSRRFFPASLTSLAALIVAFAATGCSSQYRFAVDAVRQSPASLPRQSYRLVDARPASEPGDPAFQQLAADVHTALSSKGLYEAPAGLTPDIVVEVDYGMSAPIHRQCSRTETVMAVMTPGWSSGLNRGFVPGTPGGPQQYLGTREVPYVETTYLKFLRLTARELAPDTGGALGRQVWSLHVTNDDESKDLPHYAHLMVAAAMDYIDQDHAEVRRVVLTRKDRRVTFVERGLQSS